jgi:hypothetical protein
MTNPTPAKEILVVRDGHVERLLLRAQGAWYTGPGHLRDYWRKAREALCLVTLGGAAPDLDAISAECVEIIRRKDEVNATLRMARVQPAVAEPPLAARLHTLRTRRYREVQLFNPKIQGWIAGDPLQGSTTPKGLPILPERWIWDYPLRASWAHTTDYGTVLVIRRRGTTTLALDAAGGLHLGTVRAHHRKVTMTVTGGGSWDSLIPRTP